MQVAVFSTKPYDRGFLEAASLSQGHELVFFEARLGPETAVLASGFTAVCVFVNDNLNETTLQKLADVGVRLIALRSAGFNNTSRGALIDTEAAISGLKSRKIGYLGLDVYEQEEDLFFEDLSDTVIQDDIFGRLLTFPNVLITGHQAFFTETAMTKIAETTMANITDFEMGRPCPNQVTAQRIVNSSSQ